MIGRWCGCKRSAVQGRVTALALVASCFIATASEAADISPLPRAAVAMAFAAPEVQHGYVAMQDPRRDKEALAAFTTAAAAGNAVAQTYLGYLTYVGHGTHQDDQAAGKWYRLAAQQGFIDAEIRLGLLYNAGRDLHDPARTLPRDPRQAIYWLDQAAKQGSAMAADKIGEIFLNASFNPGDTAGNLKQARQVFRQVVAYNNDPNAIRDLCFSYQTFRDNPAEQQHWCDLAAKLPKSYANGVLGDALLESSDIPMPAKTW